MRQDARWQMLSFMGKKSRSPDVNADSRAGVPAKASPALGRRMDSVAAGSDKSNQENR